MRKSKKSDDVLNVVDETTVKETSEVSEPVLNGDAETIKEFLQNVLDKMQFSCKVEEKVSGEVLSLEITVRTRLTLSVTEAKPWTHCNICAICCLEVKKAVLNALRWTPKIIALSVKKYCSVWQVTLNKR